MEKHCESVKEFGKEATATAAISATLAAFLRESSNRARQYAFELAGNGEEAKELVQEAAYRAVLAGYQYRSHRPFNRWFYSVMRNAFIDARRSFERRKIDSLNWPMDGMLFSESLADDQESVLDRLERDETMGMVRAALGRLNEQERTILILYGSECLKYREIAEVLRVPIGTVRSRLWRARRALRNQAPELAELA